MKVYEGASSSLTHIRNELLQFRQVPAQECVNIWEVDANFAIIAGVQT